MENLSFSLQNVLNENGFIISAMGMLIVFISLLLISIFIFYLPKILAIFDRIKDSKKKKITINEIASTSEEDSTDEELHAAICAVIALELELSSYGDDQHITLKAGGEGPTAWATVGKMRTLSSRIAS